MKKLLLLLLLVTLSTSMYSQQLTLPVAENVPETFQEMITKYGSELIETVKSGGTFLIEESSEVVKQYLMFTSIIYGLKLLLGLLLIFYISKKVFNLFTITKAKYNAYNDSIDEMDSPNFSKPDKYIKLFNSYFEYEWKAFIGSILYASSFLIGSFIFLSNIVIFIKVTLFPKLYITELILEMLKAKGVL